MTSDHDLVLRNYVEGYWKDCPDCHGTGCIGQAIGDPPEQCYCDQVDPPEYLDASEITDELLQELGRIPCEVRDHLSRWHSKSLVTISRDPIMPFVVDDGWQYLPRQVRILRSTVDEMRKAKEAERPDKIHAGGRGSSKSLLFAAEIKKAKEAGQ